MEAKDLDCVDDGELGVVKLERRGESFLFENYKAGFSWRNAKTFLG